MNAAHGMPAANGASETDRTPATIDASAYLSVVEEVFDGIDTVLATLDDETVNRTPLPETVNPVFALIRHLHGMASFWGGSIVAGEENPRDRAAEFRAHGTVAEAAALLADLRTRLPGWVDVAASEGIRDPHATGTSRADAAEVSAAWVLQHILQECAQHLGHMEICRDLVLAG